MKKKGRRTREKEKKKKKKKKRKENKKGSQWKSVEEERKKEKGNDNKSGMTLLLDSDKSGEWVPQIYFFIILPLSFIIHNLKTPKLCFQFPSSKLKILSF